MALTRIGNTSIRTDTSFSVATPIGAHTDFVGQTVVDAGRQTGRILAY